MADGVYPVEENTRDVQAQQVSCAALLVLGVQHRTEVIRQVREALRNPTRHRYIRRRAADILGQLGATEARPDLQAVADDPDRDLRQRVAKSLARLAGQPE